MDISREYSHPSRDHYHCISSLRGQTFGPDDGVVWEGRQEGARRIDPPEQTSKQQWPWCWFVTETDTKGLGHGEWTCDDCKGTFTFFVKREDDA